MSQTSSPMTEPVPVEREMARSLLPRLENLLLACKGQEALSAELTRIHHGLIVMSCCGELTQESTRLQIFNMVVRA